MNTHICMHAHMARACMQQYCRVRGFVGFVLRRLFGVGVLSSWAPCPHCAMATSRPTQNLSCTCVSHWGRIMTLGGMRFCAVLLAWPRWWTRLSQLRPRSQCTVQPRIGWSAHRIEFPRDSRNVFRLSMFLCRCASPSAVTKNGQEWHLRVC